MRVRCSHVGRTGVACQRTTAVGPKCTKHVWLSRAAKSRCVAVTAVNGEKCRRGATVGNRCRAHSRIERQLADGVAVDAVETQHGGPELIGCTKGCGMPLLPRQVAKHECEVINIARFAGRGLGAWS